VKKIRVWISRDTAGDDVVVWSTRPRCLVECCDFKKWMGGKFNTCGLKLGERAQFELRRVVSKGRKKS